MGRTPDGLKQEGGLGALLKLGFFFLCVYFSGQLLMSACSLLRLMVRLLCLACVRGTGLTRLKAK
jgi:hypothetical protein